MRPLRVAATAITAPGWTTPRTSTPSVVCIIRSRSAGSAAADALLQATTSSLIRRVSSSSAISSENASISARGRGPYGTRMVSAKYTKSSCGSCTSSSCSTVSPPTPESNTPTGRRRSASGAGEGTGSAGTPPVWHGTHAERSATGRRRRGAAALAATAMRTASTGARKYVRSLVVAGAGWDRTVIGSVPGHITDRWVGQAVIGGRQNREHLRVPVLVAADGFDRGLELGDDRPGDRSVAE